MPADFFNWTTLIIGALGLIVAYLAYRATRSKKPNDGISVRRSKRVDVKTRNSDKRLDVDESEDVKLDDSRDND